MKMPDQPKPTEALLERYATGERNFSEADLHGVGLRAANLSGVNFDRANLGGVDFSNANLSGAILSRADLRGAHFHDTDLRSADLSDADLRSARLSGAHLSLANLIGAKLSRASIGCAYLRGANLSQADLRGADLSGADLSGADLSGADLDGAKLSGAKFSGAKLNGAKLSGADLTGGKLDGADLTTADLVGAAVGGANLSEAKLSGANIRRADLHGADLSRANLVGADLRSADLSDADLSDANITNANLSDAKLRGANFARTMFDRSCLGALDLSEVRGLSLALHRGPSHVSTGTVALSRGAIPREFLEGCGLQDWEIISAQLYEPTLTHDQFNDVQYKAQLARMGNPLQIGALFISYSHADSEFVDVLEQRLRAEGIRFWRDVHSMVAGRMEIQVDRAIRLQDQVLLVLSKDSVNSDWVEYEVQKAREKEQTEKRDVLCPIALDDAWSTAPWPARLMKQVKEYNILDFSRWTSDDAALADAFGKLLVGLAIFYKRGPEAP